jgi:hypothetical protein
MLPILANARAMLALTMLALTMVATAADETAQAEEKPGGTYVALQVDGCGDKCPEFEIQIYDTGRMVFKPNNSKNSTKTPLNKNGMSSVYKRVAKYLQDTGALVQSAECAGQEPDLPTAIVQSVTGGQVQKATWSAGCSNQIDKARSLVKVFVNQSGMWRNINHDSRYWEKYWEDPEMTGRSETP